MRAGVRKGADVGRVTEKLDFTTRGKIEEIWIELSVKSICFFKNHPV